MNQCPTCGKANIANTATCVACGSVLDDTLASGDIQSFSPSLPSGAQLHEGLFSIDHVIGQGGFGITYKGNDTQLGRVVAIKEFFPQGCLRHLQTVQPTGGLTLADYQNIRTKFMEEARTLARFNHSGIVRVFTSFEENNTAYMVMEYLEGQTLQKILEAHTVVPEHDVVHYAEEVGNALAVVHAANLIHRDIKPDNILITDDGRVVLIDFGTARTFAAHQTVRQTAMLTPGYAPLEQYGTTARFGAYSDIYALGATLYHCLTGQLPPSSTDRASGIELRPPDTVNPNVSPAVSRAILWAMQFKVDERPQKIQDFISALKDTTVPREQMLMPSQPQSLPQSAVSPQTWPRIQPQAVEPLKAALWSNMVSDTQIETNVPPQYILSALKHSMQSYGVDNVSIDFDALSVAGTMALPQGPKGYHVAAIVVPDAWGMSTVTLVNTLKPESLDWLQAKSQVKKIVQDTNHLLRTHQFVVPLGWAGMSMNTAQPVAFQHGDFSQTAYLSSNSMQAFPGAKVNDSGMGKAASLPLELKGFNWGACLANWLWAISYQTWIGLLMLILFFLPGGLLVNTVLALYLGMSGNELAWRNRRWNSLEHFQRVQKIWAYWGGGIISLYIILLCFFSWYR